MTTPIKPTNGWDALIKIFEMVLMAIIGGVLLIMFTPFGWILMIIVALIYGGHH